ncbi:MAG: N-acetylmuramoyl-L-alanine amidase [Desulfobacterales bacterium]|jgi:hypothetical protein
MKFFLNSFRQSIAVFFFLAALLHLPSLSIAYGKTDYSSFQRSIVDYRSRLNPNFKKVKRRQTKYIIVHTSELGLKETLRVVSRGKQLRRGQRTDGGHIHYVIARNGRTYRILDRKFKADHAGISMWDGETDISKVSIGIELVGYHYAPVTDNQYRSVGILIDILQDVYGLDDKAVLTHSQVAYGPPNRWHRKNHRGRKRCAKNFIHTEAGIRQAWTYDPDVRAGRLVADVQLSKIFYGGRKLYAEEGNIITKSNTAWRIAGEDFDSPTTVYKFPDGQIFTGDQIADNIGWNKIPSNTIVLLNQEYSFDILKSEGLIKTISDEHTAWSFAGKEYNRETTIYFLPSGEIKPGSTISDWDDLPASTRLIIGYRGPYRLHKNRTAYRIAGLKYKDQKTIYFLPPKKLLVGNEIKNFNRLPAGTLIFLPEI